MQVAPPNYALRRATALLALLIVAGGVVGFVLSRCSSDTGTGTSDTVAQPLAASWDVVVLSDPRADLVTVNARDGTVLARATTTLDGVLDVGAPGVVLLGTAGDPTVDGLGVLDLATATVTPIDVRLPTVAQLGSSPFVLASDTATGEVTLIDVAARAVIDLDALAGDDPLVDSVNVRLSPDRSHLAFSELRTSRTIVLDLSDRSTVAVPGLLADLTDTAVATSTNRGDTVLVDVAGLDGTRRGTVETPPLAGLMLTAETSALGVATDGTVVAIEVTEGAATTSTVLVDAVRDRAVDTSQPAGGVGITVQRAAPMLERQRLIAAGPGFVAALDADGGLVASRAVDQTEPLFDLSDAARACAVLLGRPTEPAVVFDTTDGSLLATFAPSVPVAESDDGCTVARQELAGGPAYRVVSRSVDLRPATPVLGVAADGSALLVADAGTVWQPLTGDAQATGGRLAATVLLGAFARLADG